MVYFICPLMRFLINTLGLYGPIEQGQTLVFLSNPVSSLATLNEVIDLLWVPLSHAVWRSMSGTAFTNIFTSSYGSFTKQYLSLIYVMQSDILFSVVLNKNADHDPLNWFHNPLMSSGMQFEKKLIKQLVEDIFSTNKLWFYFCLWFRLLKRITQWVCLWFCV